MGRRSLAESIYEELEDVEVDGTWIVLYDFKERRPGTKFWDNLKRVVALAGEGSLVQYSVYMTRSGRGARTAALEGRLKLLELTYVPALAYPAGESKHGPISLIEKDVACIFVCPRDETRSHIMGSIMEMNARGARIISVCEEGDAEIARLSDEVVEMPRGIPPLLSPIPYAVPLQLLAYHLAVIKGLDPDKPRNLAKSVTVP